MALNYQIHPLKLAIANVFLVQSEKQNVLIDTGMKGDHIRIIKFLKKHQVGIEDISYIIHTHGHVDHCGSTLYFLQNHKIPTVIHQKDLNLVQKGTSGLVKTTTLTSHLIKFFVMKPYPAFQPNIMLDNNLGLSEILPEVKILHTPGHTEGSISLIFPQKEAIVGDIMRGGHLGGAIAPAKPLYHYFINDKKQLDESIKAVFAEGVEKFYVGHGGPLSRKDVAKKFNLT